MMINIGFDERHQEAIISYADMDIYTWNSFIRVLNDYTSGVAEGGSIVYLAWRSFLVVQGEIKKFVRNHQIVLKLTENAKQKLKEANVQSYSYALKQSSYARDDIKRKLDEVGFRRQLTENQINNLCKIGALPAGATFSVPGAGKTTEALSYFFLNADIDDRLLVVAPKNAFGAWDEQIDICMPGEGPFVRLRGGERVIERKLNDKPKYMLITYQQYPRVKKYIQEMLKSSSTFMFLDESHRIKGGKNIISAEAILDVSYLPKRKLIMSGTPMPQSIRDLMPQFSFLYPEKRVTEDNVVDLIQPVYVRTTQRQLDIPEIKRRIIRLKMDSLQEQVYRTLRSETRRQMAMVPDISKNFLRDMGKKIIKIMQFVSNPALLARDMEYAFDKKIGELLMHNNGPKIEYACRRAHELAAEGKKVIIWSSYVENIELITARLADLGADYIHGGVDAGDEDENDTREWKIKEFHNNKDKWVLVANPAAASEGISLHKVCRYAIYVDRSFNAAQYLQSEDRIHRLGLLSNQHPYEEILECEGTIDEVIRRRLDAKILQMSYALDDPSLNVDAIPYDFELSDNEDMNEGDIEELIKYFFGGDDVIYD